MDADVTVFPMVFIEGKLVGDLDWLTPVYISSDLILIMKEAGPF